jgi:Tfp pilus assembly PilM family ATPase
MVILEFTQDRIKLLEIAKKAKQLKISNLSKKTTAGLSDEAISSAVSGLLDETGIRRKGPIVVSLPRHLFTVRNLRLPSLDDSELKDMVALQAVKQLPSPASELIWDFRVIEKRPDGYSDILLVLGHRHVIERYLNILKALKLEAEKVVLSSEALLAWYLAASGLIAKEAQGHAIQAVVDIDTSHIDIIILREGVLEFSRSFHFKNDLKEAAEEIKKTFDSYNKDTSRTISSIAITGIEEMAGGLKGFLSGMDDIRRIEFIHPLRVTSMDYRATLSDYFDLSKDISFSCVSGVAYNSPGIRMDFLPPELKKKRAEAKKKALFIKTASLLTATSLLFLGILIKGEIDKRAAVNLVNLKIKETEPQVKRLREISQHIEIVKNKLDVRGSAVDVIREIFKIVPQQVSIAVFDFELGKSLTLRGVSTDLTSVFRFASDIEKSEYFEDYQIKYAQKRMIKERELVDFEISCKLSRMK